MPASKHPLIITSDITISLEYNVFIIDASGGNITVTIPDVTTPAMAEGIDFTFRREDNSGNTVSLVPTGTTIQGASSVAMYPGQSFAITYVEVGPEWKYRLYPISGFSGYSGIGLSGYSGFSGISGYSGFSGNSTSGFSGFSGESGYSGFSGLSGYSGFSGISGYSGYSGLGLSGYSGFSGESGYSGFSGATSTSGFSGFSGLSGYSGFSGLSGYSGYSGLSGYSGFSGTSGYSGFSGTSGYSGFSGISVITTKALSANQTSTSITPAKVTNLDQTTGTGTWVFRYFVRYRSSSAGNGVRFDVNHSGTVTSFVWNQRWVDASASASTAAPDQDNIQAAGAVMGAFSSRAKGTAGRGTTISVDTVDLDMLMIIEGLMVVTASGDLQLYFGSEVAATGTQTIMQDSSLILTKIA